MSAFAPLTAVQAEADGFVNDGKAVYFIESYSQKICISEQKNRARNLFFRFLAH